ncbi:Tn3 family transposase [Streptomyces europaeiscabiei]|uniref:Tn3 family transposase n=1 Tax=Streptomyces europaeiscabiei TaxID=146819 RepID=UPI0038D4155E
MPRGIRQRRQQQQGQLLHSSFAHTDRVFRPTDLRRTAPAAPADARPAAAEALTRAVRSRRPDGESDGPRPGAWTPPPPTCRSARPSRSTESCARTGWSSRSAPPTYLTAVGLKAAGVEIANATFAARRETVWSQGTTTVASDSTHFKAWDRNIFTEWHSRYGGRGVLVYRHIEKGSRAIHSQLLNCTASEVAAAIEGMMLRGLTAEDNSATRLLRAAGVSPEAVHRSVGARLSMGASQAAERIAWTPYSRKAIDNAEARSRHNGSDRIDCDDLLIGLAQVGRGVAAAVLTDTGFDLATLDAASAEAGPSPHE